MADSERPGVPVKVRNRDGNFARPLCEVPFFDLENVITEISSLGGIHPWPDAKLTGRLVDANDDTGPYFEVIIDADEEDDA